MRARRVAEIFHTLLALASALALKAGSLSTPASRVNSPDENTNSIVNPATTSSSADGPLVTIEVHMPALRLSQSSPRSSPPPRDIDEVQASRTVPAEQVDDSNAQSHDQTPAQFEIYEDGSADSEQFEIDDLVAAMSSTDEQDESYVLQDSVLQDQLSVLQDQNRVLQEQLDAYFNEEDDLLFGPRREDFPIYHEDLQPPQVGGPEKLFGTTLLHYSVLGNQIDVVRDLVDQVGEDPEKILREWIGNVPREDVPAWVEEASLLDLKNGNGESALWLAAAGGYVEIFDLLLARGADPKICRLDGVSSLMIAARNQHLPIVQRLLVVTSEEDRKFLLNHVDTNGDCALLFACASGNVDIFDLLKWHGSDPMIFNKFGQGALFMASSNGHVTIVEKLLEVPLLGMVDSSSSHPYWIWVSIADQNGNTPLHVASYHGHRGIVTRLLAKGANPKVQEQTHGATSLHVAVEAKIRKPQKVSKIRFKICFAAQNFGFVLGSRRSF